MCAPVHVQRNLFVPEKREHFFVIEVPLTSLSSSINVTNSSYRTFPLVALSNCIIFSNNGIAVNYLLLHETATTKGDSFYLFLTVFLC